MNIIQLYQDFSLDFKTEGHKHCRPGWVNVECPFCSGNAGYHLGFNMNENYFFCWRCGWHPTVFTISKLLHTSEYETKHILKQYEIYYKQTNTTKVNLQKKKFKLPSHTTELQRNHKIYLEKRNFDPEKLEQIWHLQGTGPVSKLDSIDYKHRIIIPFYWDEEIVSFDSRDITNKTDKRYNACPKEREKIEHKSILYGRQDLFKQTGICVEGPTDAWRFGTNAFATSGIKYTGKQVRLISKLFKRVFVVYDDDPQAIIQGRQLVNELKFRNIEAYKISIKGDPGSMDQKEADYFVKQLMVKWIKIK